MTVGELINALDHYHPIREVYTRDSHGDLRLVDDIYITDDGELVVDW